MGSVGTGAPQPAVERGGVVHGLRSVANRKPSGAAPGAAGADSSSHLDGMTSEAARHAGALPASGGSAARHPGSGAPDSTGSTTGTSLADPPGRASPSGARSRGAETRSPR